MKTTIKSSSEYQEQISKISKEIRTLAAKTGAPGTGDMKAKMEAMSASKQIKSLSNKQAKALAVYNQAEQEFIKSVSSELDQDTRNEFIGLLKKNEVAWQDGLFLAF